MNLSEQLAAVRDRRLAQLSDLRLDHVVASSALGILRNDIAHKSRSVRVRDKLANLELDGEGVVRRFEQVRTRLLERSIRDACSIFEGFFAETAVCWLASAAGSHALDEREVTVKRLRKASDISAVLAEEAEARVVKLIHSPPQQWFGFVSKHFLHKVSAAEVGAFAEIKATRNAYEHANGLATQRYVDAVAKAGGTPRKQPGEVLHVDPLYQDRAFSRIESLIRAVGDAAETRGVGVP